MFKVYGEMCIGYMKNCAILKRDLGIHEFFCIRGGPGTSPPMNQ